MTAASQYSVVLTARVFSAALTAFSLILLARVSGPERFGWFAALSGLVSVAVKLADLGHQTLAIRLHAREEKREASLAAMSTQRLLTVSATTGLLVAFTAATVAGILPKWCILLLVWQWLEMEIQGGLGISLAGKRVIQQLLVLSVQRGVGLLLFVLALNFVADVYAFLISMILSALVGLFLIYSFNPHYPLIPRNQLANEDKSKARHYWWASASAQVRNMDATLLSLVSSPIQVGLYSLPSRMAGPIRLAASAMSTVALPAASRGDRTELRSLSRMMVFISLLSFVSLVLLGIFAQSIILVTVGHEFLGSVSPLRILLVGLAFNIPGSYLSGILQGSGLERQIGRLGIFLGVLAVASVIVGGSLNGAIGAALGASFVSVVQFVAVTVLYRSER